MLVCVSIARSFRDGTPIYKDVKLGKYTVPIENRTPGRRVAVHYATAAPWKSYMLLRVDLIEYNDNFYYFVSFLNIINY